MSVKTALKRLLRADSGAKTIRAPFRYGGFTCTHCGIRKQWDELQRHQPNCTGPMFTGGPGPINK